MTFGFGFGFPRRQGPLRWTPAALSPQVWYDAADTTTVTLNGSSVSQWGDKSGNSNNAVQATPASQPQYFTYQNLAIYSEQLDNVAWTKTGAPVTANATTAPDGTTTADLLTEDTSTGGHGVAQTLSGLVDNTVYTMSAYVKPNGRSWVAVSFFDKANVNNRVWYNISTGTQGTTNGTVTAFSATAVGNGWYRLAVSASAGTGANPTGIRISMASADNTPSYTGDGVSGIYAWGAQVSLGSLQPYQLTTGVASLLGGFNNKPALVFDGTASIMLSSAATGISGSNPRTIAYVFRRAGTGPAIQVGTTTSLRAFGRQLAATSLLYHWVSDLTMAAAAVNVNNQEVLQSTGAVSTGFRDGTQIATGSYALNTFNSVLYIGGRSAPDFTSSSGFCPCTFAEIVVFTKVLSVAERQQLEGYFAWKWGAL